MAKKTVKRRSEALKCRMSGKERWDEVKVYELIGKEFSKETIEAKKILTDRGIDFKFVDIDFEESALHWLKANKIGALPVLKQGERFVVGVKDMELLL